MRNLWAAGIIAAGAIVGTFIISGRYVPVGSRDRIVYVIDRFTGSVKYCVLDECHWAKVPLDFSAQSTMPPKNNAGK